MLKWPAHQKTLSSEIDEISYHRPWNAKDNKGYLAPGIPKTSLWATDPGGVNQVGCIYTAQGFEFDYMGVIVGTDLVYRHERGGWVAQPARSADSAINNSRVRPQEQLEFLRNTYKVLMTRGMRGCYVYFQDEETGRFFQSRTE